MEKKFIKTSEVQKLLSVSRSYITLKWRENKKELLEKGLVRKLGDIHSSPLLWDYKRIDDIIEILIPHNEKIS